MRRYERAALIGTGMIGGSLAAALKRAGTAARVVGCDRDPASAEQARSLGLVDETASSAAEAARDADLVLLAVPVGATAAVCEALAPVLAARPDVLVTDCGSTKGEVLRAVHAALPFPERFVGAHPIAGTERSGPAAASAELYRGRLCLITPLASTRPDKVVECATLWQSLGAHTRAMDPAEHDRALAYVSHLPHAAAFALAATVGGVEAAGLSGGGFADTTRIAASDPVMWRDVFLSNARPLLEALARFGDLIGELERAIAGGDGAAIEQLITRARAGREKILGGAR
jgi:cyclohexadieny/prephenate dehydrogenase